MAEAGSHKRTAVDADAAGAASKKRMAPPTVREIVADEITRLAAEHWPIGGEKKKFIPQVVEDVYHRELEAFGYSSQRLMVLEFSQYLEKYAG